MPMMDSCIGEGDCVRVLSMMDLINNNCLSLALKMITKKTEAMIMKANKKQYDTLKQ